uniref:ATP/GTP binding protein-like 4 n=1 Tax=Cyprinus carpio TaxID=7962 RepID=A0A8C2GFL8_CYPCA
MYNEAGGEDALVGNVNKLMVTPPGYTGPPKKGHIIFDACFESGNLGRVDYISEFEFDLFIRPDTCNPRFRVWFNFTVENVRETQVSPDLHRYSLPKITPLKYRQYPLVSSGHCHWWREVVTCHSDMWEQRACPLDRPAGWAGLQLFSFVNAGRSLITAVIFV